MAYHEERDVTAISAACTATSRSACAASSTAWNPFLSAVLGAVVGALVGGAVTFWIAKYTIDKERQSRLEVAREDRRNEREAASRPGPHQRLNEGSHVNGVIAGTGRPVEPRTPGRRNGGWCRLLPHASLGAGRARAAEDP